jgi:hypothetical protein
MITGPWCLARGNGGMVPAFALREEDGLIETPSS